MESTRTNDLITVARLVRDALGGALARRRRRELPDPRRGRGRGVRHAHAEREHRAVGNGRPYHYVGSGKTYDLKGVAFGNAVLELKKYAGGPARGDRA